MYNKELLCEQKIQHGITVKSFIILKVVALSGIWHLELAFENHCIEKTISRWLNLHSVIKYMTFKI